MIVDSPPLLAVADAAVTARWIDGVLVITRAGVSTSPAASNARDMLDKVGARVLGVVVWGLEKSGGRSHGYGGYYGGYYSEYYDGAQADSGTRATLKVAPVRRHTGQSVASEERGSRGPAGRLSGWRLGLVVFVAVVVALSTILLLLNGWLGWGLLGARR